jgi:murein L,D-transpeptidase YafK
MPYRVKFLLVFCLMFVCVYAGASYLLKDFKLYQTPNEKRKEQKTLLPVSMQNEFAAYEGTEVADSLALPDSLAKIDTLLVAYKSKYRMHLYAKGKFLKTYIIALGQSPLGHKVQQGDNHTPEGMYKIIQKSRGPFYGDASAYFGVAWMRLNYPNNADAVNGFKKGLITEAQKNAIVKANNAGKEPPKNTKLGGGIGIHGWNGSWPDDDQQNLTWGCISVQNDELNDLYKKVPVGSSILILP